MSGAVAPGVGGLMAELHHVAPAQRLWIPGGFPSTNELLEAQRSDGFKAGQRYYKRHVRHERVAPQAQHGARLIMSLRKTAAARALRDLKPCDPQALVRLGFWLIGHHRYDPDAWYLAAKHVTDGLQDACIFGAGDGHALHSTEGTCTRTPAESVAAYETLVGPWGRPECPAGMIVEVTPWG